MDYDDWKLSPGLFAWLDSKWGPHTIDRFADANNKQLERFNSRFWNPGSEAVDTFTTHWGFGENNWWCPPPYLVPRLLKHANQCGAIGTLVVPKWPSAPFWPMIFTKGEVPEKFVLEVIHLAVNVDTVLPGRSGGTLFKGEPNTGMLALRLNFARS